MWWTFPQLRGLGSSEDALYFGISGLKEAQAYMEHDLLRKRYAESARLVLESGKTAGEVFGTLDALKLRSSLTLFQAAEPGRHQFM